MKDNNLTNAEIKKALECCTTNGASCKDCPAFVKVDRSNCKKYFRGALDLINRQKANLDDKEDTIPYADKVIKSLQADMDKLQANVSELVKQTKAEAYRECMARVEDRLSHKLSPELLKYIHNDLQNELKEMVENK
jgi:predicted transcriptional regulator